MWLIPASKDGVEAVLDLPWIRILVNSLGVILGLLETPRSGAEISPQGPFKAGSQPTYPTPDIKPIVLPKGLSLYPFQEETIWFIESRNGRALVALEMGLGKTCCALAWLRIHPELRPVIIIVPASLKINWSREANIWLDKKDTISILSGRPGNGNMVPKDASILIVNYDILFDQLDKRHRKVISLGWWSVLKTLNPKVMILDECHYCKSVNARRTKAVEALASSSDLETSIPFIIGLSGTPIVNRPIEFYTIINLINPKLFPNWWRFTTRYCGRFQKEIYIKGGKKRRISDFTGATNIDELYTILSENLMIRKLKRDVLQDLPDKVRSVVPLEISNRAEYQEAELDFINWLRREEGDIVANKAEKAETLVKLGKLKSLTLRGKLKASIGWIKNVIDNDEKLVVFVTRHETADALLAEFGKQAVKLTGKESMEERQSSIDRFQTDESVLLFIGMIDSQGKPAGVGLTLTAATHVAFIGMQFSPLVHDQAEDRCHRIGQKNAVNVYYLVAEKTIEEDVIALLDQKREVLRRVLDGEVPEEGSILTELLNRYRNKET